jgi:hypothetical protein
VAESCATINNIGHSPMSISGIYIVLNTRSAMPLE